MELIKRENILKLSIITVNLNNAEGLQKTIESVISQTFTDYEYIIIDGGSTDESTEIIKKYANKITYWVSEPDKGIYNGMNKGIKVAKGEYCLFLNSGDWLIDNNVLQSVFDNFPNKDIVYGNLAVNKQTIKFSSKITLLTFVEGSIPHPASFIKKQLFSKYGLYNEKNKIVSDWEFFIKTIIIENCSYCHISNIITVFDDTGISSIQKYREIKKKEKSNILISLFPLIYDDYITFLKTKDELKKYKNSRLHIACNKIQKMIPKRK